MNPTTSGDALAQMQQYQSSLQSPTDVQNSQEQQLGIPGAEQQVSGLRQAITNTTNLLQNVRPSIEGRTANSLVTSAQAEHQIANESAPISKTLADQTAKEGQSESDLNNLRTRASQNTALTLQGQDSKMNYLKSIYDQLFGKERAQAQDAQAAADQAEKQREFNASQDQARSQFNASQSLEQQKLAEQIREANLSSASSSGGSSSGGGSSGGSKAPSAAEVKQADMAGAGQYLNSLKGKDGHVSQQTWNNAMSQWINAGYSAKDFTNQFMQFINQHYRGYHGFD